MGCLIAALLAGAALPVAAQQRVRITARTELLKAAGGPILGRLERGTEWAGARADRQVVELTVEGWVFGTSIGETTREGFNAIVNDRQGQNLRADPRPDGRLLGRLNSGALVQRLETRNGWVRVRRQAWVARTATDAGAAASAPQPAATTPVPAANAPSPARDTATRSASPSYGDGSRATAPGGAVLRATPGGTTVGTLASGSDVRVVTRAGGWTRVRIDAWVPDTALETSGAGAAAGVTAAEVRAEPARWIGQVVDWKLQVVAVQVADALRSDLPEGKPYLLTRGPLPESGFVYVLVTP
ncbi:MAG TPA: SH3 domain-containing protein, partial [Gemmatimonadales bacterium]|nr:SH3 domain-containing protein [Gemmatimonadales bacterium]